jgi:hypothetical protein
MRPRGWLASLVLSLPCRCAVHSQLSQSVSFIHWGSLFPRFRTWDSPYSHLIHFMTFLIIFRPFAKLRKASISFVLSVCPSVCSHWTDFHEIWHFSIFSKNCRENSSFIIIWQEQRVFYMKPDLHFWYFQAQFFTEWKMCQTEVVENNKTHIWCSVSFLLNSCRLWGNVEKYGTARQQATDMVQPGSRPQIWYGQAAGHRYGTARQQATDDNIS